MVLLVPKPARHVRTALACSSAALLLSFARPVGAGYYVFQAQQTDTQLDRAWKVMNRTMIAGMCEELDRRDVFTCREIWQNGFSGTSDDVDEHLTMAELYNVMDLLEIPERDTTRWHAAPDDFLEDQIGTRFLTNNVTEETQSNNVPPSVDLRTLLATGANQVQLQAPVPLSTMSRWSGGCESACQEGALFRYVTTGRGVTIYVVDGYLEDHSEFQSTNATAGSRISADRYMSPTAMLYRGNACAASHATHVAGLAAGLTYGAGKDATIVSVAVQPGCSANGRSSELAESLDWILERMMEHPGPAIVSMSLLISTNSRSAALVADKVEDLLDAGAIVVVASGNKAGDACDYAPGNIPGVITVAATYVDEAGTSAWPWAASNTGHCVDLWAPGVAIQSAAPDCNVCTAWYSGTSQAAPLVSGIVAQYLERNPTANWEVVKQYLAETATQHALVWPRASTTLNFGQVDLRSFEIGASLLQHVAAPQPQELLGRAITVTTGQTAVNIGRATHIAPAVIRPVS